MTFSLKRLNKQSGKKATPETLSAMNEPKKKNLLSELLDSITPAEQLKTDKKMILAAKIANAIKAKGLKKSEFAEILSKQPSEISKWLSGTHNFTIDTLMDIERVLSVHLLNISYPQEQPLGSLSTSSRNSSNRLTSGSES